MWGATGGGQSPRSRQRQVAASAAAAAASAGAHTLQHSASGNAPTVVTHMEMDSPGRAKHEQHLKQHSTPLAATVSHARAPSRLVAWLPLTALDADVLANTLACAGASMADPLMSLVDTAFVGRLGLIPLAALGPNSALFNVIFFLCFTSLAVLCVQSMASANAKGDSEGVGRGFFTALTAAAVVSVSLMVLLVTAPEAVLALFQTNAEMMELARTYCTIRALCIPAALGMAVCQAAFRSVLDLRTPFLVVMASGVANLILDQLFMFNFGWGMAGCGWASVASQYLGAALFAVLIYQRRHQFGLVAALDGAGERRHGSSGSSSGKYGSSNGGSGTLLLLPRHHTGSTNGVITQTGSVASAQGGVNGAVGVVGRAVGRRRGSGVARLLLLVASLDWRSFLWRYAALTARGVLILSTYTSASVMAARAGTRVIAGHQVVQQQQQLQMSVAWSFLHVGQSMVANVLHLPTGAKAAARIVGNRVIGWGAALSISMALITFSMHERLSSMFVSDGVVLEVVGSAVLPATVMLGLSWNNALEGCLLGADDAPYVVKVYPCAVVTCLTWLIHASKSGLGLTGVWWGLALYYFVLLLGFAWRYFVALRPKR